MKIAKGEHTRLTIIDQARAIFNQYGISITIDMVAREMGTTKSRITNHFATKDQLFIAIMAEYEQELGSLVAKWYPAGVEKSLQVYVDMLSEIMDMQFKYRCAIVYLNMLSPSQHELKQQTHANFKRTMGFTRQRMEGMQKAGLIHEAIFQEPAWSAFLFAYVNLLTQWVVFQDMYDDPGEYEVNKQKYLRGVMNHVYLPYLTKKGMKESEALVYP
jgi:AcrR family transcriptional regulator